MMFSYLFLAGCPSHGVTTGAPPVLRPVALACSVGHPEAQHLQDTRRDAYMTLCHLCMIHYESASLILFPKP